MGRVVILIVVAVLCCLTSTAQRRIDVDAYEDYMKSRRGMTTEGLLQEYPAGKFASAMPTNPMDADFFDAIYDAYKLTNDEFGLLAKNSFVVSERLTDHDYYRAYYKAFGKDLPIYISSDALLHAFHRTYANALSEIEASAFYPALYATVDSLRATIAREARVKRSPIAQKAREDVDVYLAVAYSLLREETYARPIDTSLRQRTSQILDLIYNASVGNFSIFTDGEQLYDFSQMTPRSHYGNREDYRTYFMTIQWLSRVEIVISPADGTKNPMSEGDVVRQNAMAIDLVSLMTRSGSDTIFRKIDNLLQHYVGEQDNITIDQLAGIIRQRNLSPESVRDSAFRATFHQDVAMRGGNQRILSQILLSSGGIVPASAFMPLGQRFVFDAYILGNVVYDKTPTERLMPDPLDVLFVLGNDAAAQLLIPEIDKYGYACNLASLRYLTSSFDESFWNASLYSTWIAAIRELNPPQQRESLPPFMRTAAWWQKTMNTQLCSWAELRHDNALYAKQSYTGGLSCFYPKGFVEPVPGLYRRLSKAAGILLASLDEVAAIDSEIKTPSMASRIDSLRRTLGFTEQINSALAEISEKELRGIPLSLHEMDLVNSWIIRSTPPNGCVDEYNGEYPKLLYGVSNQMLPAGEQVITDVHTQPTNEGGDLVGRILHVGTGHINMAVVIAKDLTDGCDVAYVGPVGSFYQGVSENFDRVTNDRWHFLFGPRNKNSRPQWTWLYTADASGARRDTDAMSLLTSVSDEQLTLGSFSVTPNPSSGPVLITIPTELHSAGGYVTISDVQGQTLQRMDIPSFAASPTVEWTGTDTAGNSVSSGQYVITIVSQHGTRSQTVTIRR